MQRLLGNTLLLAGLGLGVSPESWAEESVEIEAGESAKAFAATSLGAIGGLGASYIGGFIVCNQLGERDWTDCRYHPAVFAGALLGGVASGYGGYKNGPLALVFGGVFSGSVVGAFASGIADNGIPFFLGASAGGYLGYRLWKVREASGSRYSLSPYWDEKKSGVVLSGQF